MKKKEKLHERIIEHVVSFQLLSGSNNNPRPLYRSNSSPQKNPSDPLVNRRMNLQCFYIPNFRFFSLNNLRFYLLTRFSGIISVSDSSRKILYQVNISII